MKEPGRATRCERGMKLTNCYACKDARKATVGSKTEALLLWCLDHAMSQSHRHNHRHCGCLDLILAALPNVTSMLTLFLSHVECSAHLDPCKCSVRRKSWMPLAGRPSTFRPVLDCSQIDDHEHQQTTYCRRSQLWPLSFHRSFLCASISGASGVRDRQRTVLCGSLAHNRYENNSAPCPAVASTSLWHAGRGILSCHCPYKTHTIAFNRVPGQASSDQLAWSTGIHFHGA
jgi:hypothetical protein